MKHDTLQWVDLATMLEIWINYECFFYYYIFKEFYPATDRAPRWGAEI